ncbi:hypothetical protein C5167_012649 [Papaver somniferum]|uniref:Uncharacterized protein n=1 Tax=Papaver somniferum TaxID=3469 RepID=A0A4Y7IY21_PAPSO|nr:hypothetical protein C5167_012649 [Papaver somniferum]
MMQFWWLEYADLMNNLLMFVSWDRMGVVVRDGSGRVNTAAGGNAMVEWFTDQQGRLVVFELLKLQSI